MTRPPTPMLAPPPVPLVPVLAGPDVAFMPRAAVPSRPLGHDQLTKLAVVRHLAELLEGRFLGILHSAEPSPPGTAPLLLVPSDTLVQAPDATSTGRVPEVFGGIVPHAFVATKVITHPLVAPNAQAPLGWNPAFPDAVADVVLPGWSVFTGQDAVTATARLLAGGSVRAKLPSGIGGSGQQVLRSMDELHEMLARLPAGSLHDEGLVLERNLRDVQTFSVGQVRIGGRTATYCGTQRLTPNHAGHAVYGGSRLMVARGDVAQLLAQPLEEDQRRAVERAMVYHDAALRAFPGLVATRWNYDVAQGVDDAGQACAGVLEQSWRIGGATGAELAALQAFHDDATLDLIEAETVEVYGEPTEVPPGARVYYDGTDPQVGRLVKYAVARRYGHA